jgi:uncharacterized protein (TIGR01319 family)
MIPQKLICVDIGSTYTKGAVFNLKEECFEVLERAVFPTSINYLPDAFYKVLNAIQPDLDPKTYRRDQCPIFFSSSAKGGLKIAVVGLVPEMSLNIGRLAAFSAGAKICASYPYSLSRANIRAIERDNPDILLLCGGTDGGNARYAIENSKALAASAFTNTIIYAGNAQADEDVEEILQSKDLIITENVMPDFGKLNIEPVREAIRKVFLAKIVSGRGLDELVKAFGALPVPTPLAVFNLVKAMGQHEPEFEDCALIDMGGATTDFYSYTESFDYDGETVMKGIIEPKLKRSVEGDLGMRVSAESAYETGKDYFAAIGLSEDDIEAMDAYTKNLTANPDYLPENKVEMGYDSALAGACLYHSLLRHAGTVDEVYTIKGRIWVQSGKDLRRVKKIIGTGGYLAAMGRADEKIIIPTEPCVPCEQSPLLPQKFEYFSDNTYILPLLANLAETYPKQCAKTATKVLESAVKK